MNKKSPMLDQGLDPGLYVVATPIGNLGDMSYRAVETLKRSAVILCEDTRQTAKLCQAYGIETRRAPYHDHNGARVRPGILQQLQSGMAISLVSDAGTPLISDPGYKLVAEARAAAIPVTTIPGPSAAIAALSIAGLPSDQFYFAGFIPQKQKARDQLLQSLTNLTATLIFYEAPSRLNATLTQLYQTLGDRQSVIARELTKLHEEIIMGTLSTLIDNLAAIPSLKGELVILVEPPDNPETSHETLDHFLKERLGSMSIKDIARDAADQLGVPRKNAYDRAIALKTGSLNPEGAHGTMHAPDRTDDP